MGDALSLLSSRQDTWLSSPRCDGEQGVPLAGGSACTGAHGRGATAHCMADESPGTQHHGEPPLSHEWSSSSGQPKVPRLSIPRASPRSQPLRPAGFLGTGRLSVGQPPSATTLGAGQGAALLRQLASPSTEPLPYSQVGKGNWKILDLWRLGTYPGPRWGEVEGGSVPRWHSPGTVPHWSG